MSLAAIFQLNAFNFEVFSDVLISTMYLLNSNIPVVAWDALNAGNITELIFSI